MVFVPCEGCGPSLKNFREVPRACCQKTPLSLVGKREGDGAGGFRWLLRYLIGDTITEIADAEGASRQTVSDTIKKHGAVRPQDRPRKRWMYIAARNAVPLQARAAYQKQRSSASRRGVGWEFDLHSWWLVWTNSEKWNLRGTRRGQYVMARFNDAGPYSPSNVYITTSSDNSREAVQVRKADLALMRRVKAGELRLVFARRALT